MSTFIPAVRRWWSWSGRRGPGIIAKIEGQAHATQAQIGYAQQPEMRCAQPNDRAAVPECSDDEGSTPDARRNESGAPKGNRNNFKHGRYSAKAIAGRRKIRELVRAMSALARV